MGNYRELDVWKTGMEIVDSVFDATNAWPKSGHFELKSQIKRSAMIIPSNIAEGAGRGNDKEFRRFLTIAKGSCQELMTQLEIAHRGNLLDKRLYAALSDMVDHEGRMIWKLVQRL